MRFRYAPGPRRVGEVLHRHAGLTGRPAWGCSAQRDAVIGEEDRVASVPQLMRVLGHVRGRRPYIRSGPQPISAPSGRVCDRMTRGVGLGSAAVAGTAAGTVAGTAMWGVC